ncbi:hypothetical protein GCM10007385_08420 [Tateyamaria omphalii]|uniref:copper chaperone PCu(A)C n=1 Tax=Tateyamaria omphalii TaxID=299262 RepID=UPI00167A4E75|nr:copper uptake system-associated protein [Tateyamaria omphalii]GGX42929.1 hypothetical protein GCM10007385_08420 [Tateyamaria omphalii]
MRRVLLFIFAIICATPVMAHEYLVGNLAIIHPHTPPTGPEINVANGYMELFNGGSEPERLLAVRSGIADVSFFDPTGDDGRGLRVADAIEISPGQSVPLGPDELQIRFAGLDTPLRIGDRFLATLVFETVGEVTVEFWVEGIPETLADPVLAMPTDTPPDDAAIADIARQLRARLGAETDILTTSVAGSAAVVGWALGNDAGRAFLRQRNENWQLVLLSGGSLLSPAGLRAQGLSPRLASELFDALQENEARLPGEMQTRLNAFEGTLIVPAE